MSGMKDMSLLELFIASTLCEVLRSQGDTASITTLREALRRHSEVALLYLS